MTGLQEWFDAQQASTSDEMYYKQASAEQMMFVRDQLAGLFAAGLSYEEYRAIVAVVSEHTSKSVRLPVYSLARADISLRIVLRNNFYNWKLSVVSEVPVEVDLSGLCHTTPPLDPKYTGNPLAPVYFEGFPEDLIFDYYATTDKRRWSAEIHGNYALMTVIFLILRARGAIKPARWEVRGET